MRRVQIVIGFFIGCFLVAGSVFADQDDTRLDALFERLQRDVNSAEIQHLETQIWAIWIDSGREDVNALMTKGIEAMGVRDLSMALDIFDQIVEMAPEFAEGWNKRATVHYLKNNLSESVQDIQRTLDLEPRHFGALSGMGLIFMRIGDEAGALQAYQEVVKIHPRSPSARFHIQVLRTKLRDQMI